MGIELDNFSLLHFIYIVLVIYIKYSTIFWVQAILGIFVEDIIQYRFMMILFDVRYVDEKKIPI